MPIETVKQWNTSTIALKCFRSFVHQTVQICPSIVRGRSEAVRMTMHRYQTYNFRFQLLRQKLCRPITLHPSVAIATCRKTCFPQISLLQYKSKPHLGFQNLGCRCKILGCLFDTQKRLKKTPAVSMPLALTNEKTSSYLHFLSKGILSQQRITH